MSVEARPLKQQTPYTLGSTQYFFSGIKTPDEFNQRKAQEERSHQIKVKYNNPPRPVRMVPSPSVNNTLVLTPQARGIEDQSPSSFSVNMDGSLITKTPEVRYKTDANMTTPDTTGIDSKMGVSEPDAGSVQFNNTRKGSG